MSTPFDVVIPARLNSSRFPGKLLMDLNGMSVLERVWHQALKANPKSIVIATDSSDIAEHAKSFGANVVMTKSTHCSGTDRISELVLNGLFSLESVIVNVQGDEPFIEPLLIEQVAAVLNKASAPVASLYWPIDDKEQISNSNVVKVVCNYADEALYFSRSTIPFHREDLKGLQQYRRHIGLYAYRASFLQLWPDLPTSPLEMNEGLEQLRILWAGQSIQLARAKVEPLQDINTLTDLNRARVLASTLV